MQTASCAASQRPAAATTAGGGETVFEVFLPHLEDIAGGSSFPGSPTRWASNSGEVTQLSSPVPPSGLRPVRGDAARHGGFSSFYLNSTRHSLSGDVDGLGSTAGSIAAAPNPLTKPTLSPLSIRCCSQDQWVPDAHVVSCMAPDCSTSFTLFNRKYHCRMCGRVFCSSCCSFPVTIPRADGASSSSSTSALGSAMAASAVASALTTEAADVAALPLDWPLAGAAAMNSLAAAISNDSRTPSIAVPPSRLLFNGKGLPAAEVTVAPPAAATAAAAASSSTFRVCNSCRYELHLVIPTRRENGEPRRKSRGEMKMFQWALVVNILSFLPLPSLLETALVSSDFYFMTKDNLIWYRYNMTRWLKDAEQTQSQLSLAGAGAKSRARKGGGTTAFEAAPVLQDATALSESEAAKRVISLHARYNFTQFLDFTRRQEMARCEGLSSFSVGARILLSSPVKIALIGPSGVGKTASVRGFVGRDAAAVHGGTASSSSSSSAAAAAAPPAPTIGFARSVKTVRLVGDVSTDVTLHLYDISGAPRYEALRRFICAQCHAIGLCYDPTRKVTLVEAADVMMGIEAALGPQPVVVCGLLRPDRVEGTAASPSASANPFPSPSLASPRVGGVPQGALPHRVVSEEDAIAITVRTAGSLQCPVTQCDALYKKLLQCLLECLAMATMVGNTTVAEISGEVTEARGSLDSTIRGSVSSPPGVAPGAPPHRRGRPKASRVTAQELLNLTMQPCALDVLLDPK